jgi:glycine dehydrogenase subunit 1
MVRVRRSFPYIPNSDPEIKAQMLREVGAANEMDLFSEIPEHLKLKRRMKLPAPIPDEESVRRHVEELLEKDWDTGRYLNFLGAGAADHFVPAVCDEINSRGEFLTAYGGGFYADHGKWQAFFEYCSLMGDLLDMDVLSAPLYDGGQAAASAVRMASRINGRKEILIPHSLSPELGLILRNYLQPEITIKEFGFEVETGELDLSDLESQVSSRTSAVMVENPSYLGLLESRSAEVGKIARENGAEFIVHTDPISLGVVAPPVQYGATIVSGDFHPLGIHQYAGGGQGGFIATNGDMKYVNQFKDQLWGVADTVVKGEYGFGEVLYGRTSYGSREKGNEYAGTTTGLWAITVAVYLSLMGPKGMEQTGRTIMQMSQYAAGELTRIKGVKLRFRSPFFKEFVLDFGKSGRTVAKINEALLKRNIIGGKDLSNEFPELGQSALYCVTETKTKEDIDRLAVAIKEVV